MLKLLLFQGIEILVNGINISSIVLSGTGVANGVLDLIFVIDYLY